MVVAMAAFPVGLAQASAADTLDIKVEVKDNRSTVGYTSGLNIIVGADESVGITYQATIKNNGSSTASGIVVKNVMPTGLSYLGSTVGDVVSGVDIGSILPGDTKTFEINVKTNSSLGSAIQSDITFNFADGSSYIYGSYIGVQFADTISYSAKTISLPSGNQGQLYNGYIDFITNQPYNGKVTVDNTPAGLTWGSLYTAPASGGEHIIRVTFSGYPVQIGRSYFQVVFNKGTSAEQSLNYYYDVNYAPAGGDVSKGNNVVYNGTVYYVLPSGTHKQPYTSAGAFLSYSFNSWSAVLPATTADIALPVTTSTPPGSVDSVPLYVNPRTGSLINDNGTIYIVTGGVRAGFSSAHVFLSLGYSFSNAMPGDTSFMMTLAPINSDQISHPNGTVVNEDGTLYLMDFGNKVGFPSMEVFNSWGFKLNEVVKANSYDKARPQTGVMQMMQPHQFGV